MSTPLGREREQPERDGPRPTEHQLRMAHIRAGVTGESLSQVLAVFMGAGRYGEQPGAPGTEPELPLAHGQSEPSAPPDRGTDDGDGSARLARVIPLSRAARGGPGAS